MLFGYIVLKLTADVDVELLPVYYHHILCITVHYSCGVLTISCMHRPCPTYPDS